MRMLGTLSYYSVKHKIRNFFSSDHWQMERETNDECHRWTIFSCANVSILMRTVLFSDVIWGVDPAILVSNTLSSGHSVFLPKSRCSEPCDLGAVKVRHHRGVRVIMMILLQKMSEGEKCCWVCTWCQVILSPSRIEKRISKPRVMIQLNWFMGMAWTVLMPFYHYNYDYDRITSSWWTSSVAGTAGWAGGLTQTSQAALTLRWVKFLRVFT